MTTFLLSQEVKNCEQVPEYATRTSFTYTLGLTARNSQYAELLNNEKYFSADSAQRWQQR